MLKETFTRILYVLMMAVVFIVTLTVATFLPNWVIWTLIGLWLLAYISKPFIKWLVERES